MAYVVPRLIQPRFEKSAFNDLKNKCEFKSERKMEGDGVKKSKRKAEALWDQMFENALAKEANESDESNEHVESRRSLLRRKIEELKRNNALVKSAVAKPKPEAETTRVRKSSFTEAKAKAKAKEIAKAKKEKEEEESESEYSDNDSDSDSSASSAANSFRTTLMLLKGGASDITENWKEELTEEEIKKYEWIFNNLEEMQLTVPKILRSNLSDKEKEEAINVLANESNPQVHDNTARLIKKRKEVPIPLEQLQRYEELEKQLLRETADKMGMKYRILDLPMPSKFKRNVWDVYEQIRMLEAGQGDYHKHYEWLQWILQMPWGKFSATPVFRDSSELRKVITDLRVELDSKIYGMHKLKEEILLFCMDHFLPTSFNGVSRPKRGRILTIEGSPGVGKTHLIRTLAQCWGLPFVGIAAGGCKDASFWEGHGRTYEGAVPGRIVHAVKQLNSMNGIIYIDELDKLSDQSQDVSSALMHLLDETQNSEWYDKYFGDVPLDLSNIMWILTINDRKTIHPVLRDRLHIVAAPDPTVSDKVATGQSILIPEMLTSNGLEVDEIEFPNDVLQHIINSKTAKEKGLRAFKQCIEAIIQRVAYLKHTLVSLPVAAVWHAATATGTAGTAGTANVTKKKKPNKEERDLFAKQTSFYFPEFRMPLVLTVPIVDHLLQNFKPSEDFDYVKAGWII